MNTCIHKINEYAEYMKNLYGIIFYLAKDYDDDFVRVLKKIKEKIEAGKHVDIFEYTRHPSVQYVIGTEKIDRFVVHLIHLSQNKCEKESYHILLKNLIK